MALTWTKRLTIVTPLIVLVSMMTAGAGHGTPVPTALCYPIIFCFSVFKSGGGPLLWAVLLGQFPMYGLIIDLGNLASRQLVALGIVVMFHAALILLTATSTEFWKQ